jgi:hypothetical protein
MVPSLERTEYMYELHGIAENIVFERCKHSKVRPTTKLGGGESYKEADGAQDVQAPKGPLAAVDSPPVPSDVHVEPVFHIPMTQDKTLEELPSQLDFEWTESSTPAPSSAPATARNLSEDVHVDSTPQIAAQTLQVDVDSFVQVSQIAHEAVMDATQHLPSTTTTVTDDGCMDQP